MRKALLVSLCLAVIVAAYWVVPAGDLEPPGPPAPTMKTLDEIPGSWHRKLPADDGDVDGCNSSRFKCVMGGDAVLDLETGLVWQRDAGAIPGFNLADVWTGAIWFCARARDGNRAGWRLPTQEELVSLIDLDNPELPLLLPTGHPFLSVDADYYWTATSWTAGPSGSAWWVNFGGDPASPGSQSEIGSKTGGGRYWCVRAGHSPDRPSASIP